MTRNEEYRRLLEELDESPPALAYALPRAQARLRRRRRLWRPAVSLACFFCCFVLLVNFCAPVAYACSRVPFLRELAAAVTFSPSLSQAVDHEYVQPIDLKQTQNGVTASVEYLIVDQKQVNVFYRLDAEGWDWLNEDPQVLDRDGGSPPPCSYGLNEWGVPNGELRCLTIDFVEEDVPDALRLKLRVWGENEGAAPTSKAAPAGLLPTKETEDTQDYLAEFTFTITFDPTFTASGRVIPVEKTLLLDGQSIVIRQVEIYPTHLRLDIEDDPGNTAWPVSLNFSIQLDNGQIFEPISNGITATGSTDSPLMNSYRAESPYFESAGSLTILVTGAEWLDKADGKSRLDLRTGQIDKLPEGVSFHSAQQLGDTWEVEFLLTEREKNHFYQAWRNTYYDAQGNSYDIRCTSSGLYSRQEPDGSFSTVEGVQLNTLYLEGYPYDEVWLCPQYSRLWQAETPVALTIDLTP